MARSRSGAPLVLEIPSFHGGSMLLTDPDKLDPYRALQIFNMDLDELGFASERRGTLAVGSIGAAGDRVISAHIFQREGAATQILVYLSDGSLRYSTDLITWVTIATALTTTYPMAFVTFLDKVWMANGVNDFRSWDGTTQVLFASAPKGRFVEVWKDTLWQAGDPANKDRVYSSAAGDPTTWPAFNFVDIAKGQGVGIRGLGEDAAALVVFKLGSTHAIYDPVEFTNRVVDSHKGTLSHFSIIKHDGVIYFVSHLGICRYLGDAPSVVVSPAISPMFHESLYAEADEHLWWGYVVQDRVGWCWPRTNIADAHQIENYPKYPDTPWMFHQMPVRIILTSRDPADQEVYIGFGRGNNKTFLCYDKATHADDGVAVAGKIKTGWFDFELPTAPKYVDRILLQARIDPVKSVELQVFKDFDFSAPAASFTITSTSDELRDYTVYTDIYCRHISFRLNGTASAGGATEREVIVGSTPDLINPGSFGIGRLVAYAKPCGEYR